MSVDAYVVCDEWKEYVHLGKLMAGGFVFGSTMRDPKATHVGRFIGRSLGNPTVHIVRSDDIPPGYREWVDDADDSNDP